MYGWLRKGSCIGLVLVLVCSLSLPALAGSSQPEGISAASAVLISADTGSVLYEKEAEKKLSMASTTKIMTALLALEEAEKEGDPTVTVTEEMVAVEGSSMGLRAGDELPLTGLAAGMLLASGNDAANAVALYLDGSQEAFAERMNRRALEIGMSNTHFVTPSGLDDEAHYSTAFDMALLAREALKNSKFRELASSGTYQIAFDNPEKKVQYTNHNKLLWLYEGCIGVKTGFTKKSGRCLVSAAERDGVTLIAVTLNAPDDWNDHAKMLDYGFASVESVAFDESNFSVQLPLGGGEGEELLVKGTTGGSVSVPSEDAGRITRKVFLPAFLYAPIQKGETVGSVQYYLESTKLFSIPLIAGENGKIQEKEVGGILEKLFGRGK